MSIEIHVRRDGRVEFRGINPSGFTAWTAHGDLLKGGATSLPSVAIGTRAGIEAQRIAKEIGAEIGKMVKP